MPPLALHRPTSDRVRSLPRRDAWTRTRIAEGHSEHATGRRSIHRVAGDGKEARSSLSSCLGDSARLPSLASERIASRDSAASVTRPSRGGQTLERAHSPDADPGTSFFIPLQDTLREVKRESLEMCLPGTLLNLMERMQGAKTLSFRLLLCSSCIRRMKVKLLRLMFYMSYKDLICMVYTCILHILEDSSALSILHYRNFRGLSAAEHYTNNGSRERRVARVIARKKVIPCV